MLFSGFTHKNSHLGNQPYGSWLTWLKKVQTGTFVAIITFQSHFTFDTLFTLISQLHCRILKSDCEQRMSCEGIDHKISEMLTSSLSTTAELAHGFSNLWSSIGVLRIYRMLVKKCAMYQWQLTRLRPALLAADCIAELMKPPWLPVESELLLLYEPPPPPPPPPDEP